MKKIKAYAHVVIMNPDITAPNGGTPRVLTSIDANTMDLMVSHPVKAAWETWDELREYFPGYSVMVVATKAAWDLARGAEDAENAPWFDYLSPRA